MTEKAATHGKSIILFTDPGQDYPRLGQAMETSTVLHNMAVKGLLGGSVMPTALGLEHDEMLYTQQQIIASQQQIIAVQNQEIRRLQQLVENTPQELASAANAATDSEEDLEPDYSAMEAEARLRAPSGVNWKTASRPKSYSEIMDIRYDPDAEER